MARGVLILVTFFVVALAASGATAANVLFDNTHGERFVIGESGPLQLSGLATLVSEAGGHPSPLDQPISDASLSGADALVISGAFRPLGEQEIDALLRFMQRGGKVAVMLHIAPPLATLLDRLHVSYTKGVIRENDNVIDSPLNFRVTRLGSHPVLKGVKEFSLYGVWGLINRNDNSRIIASTGSNAWIDFYNDQIQRKETTASFGVAVAGDVGRGGFLIFGDDAIFQNKFLDDDNKKLAANLAAWLK